VLMRAGQQAGISNPFRRSFPGRVRSHPLLDTVGEFRRSR
jgi:hypothetical protein